MSKSRRQRRRKNRVRNKRIESEKEGAVRERE